MSTAFLTTCKTEKNASAQGMQIAIGEKGPIDSAMLTVLGCISSESRCGNVTNELVHGLIAILSQPLHAQQCYKQEKLSRML